MLSVVWGPEQRNRYRDLLWAERSGDRISFGVTFSAPFQTGPESHPATYTIEPDLSGG